GRPPRLDRSRAAVRSARGAGADVARGPGAPRARRLRGPRPRVLARRAAHGRGPRRAAAIRARRRRGGGRLAGTARAMPEAARALDAAPPLALLRDTVERLVDALVRAGIDGAVDVDE